VLPVALAVAGVGSVLRLVGMLAFGDTPVGDLVIRQSVTGLLLHALAVALALRGWPDLGAFVSGTDFLRMALLTPRFGTGSELYLYALVLPFLAIALVRLPLWLRGVLAGLPILGFAALRLRGFVPLTTGLLDEVPLRRLATVNTLVFSLLGLGLAVYAWALAERARARAERLAEARTQLVDDMSHELRTPLAVLLTAAQGALQAERSGDAYRRTLGMMERQARSLGQMVERMLEMGRVERAELAVIAEDDLVEAVERIVDDHRPLAEARAVSLELAAAPLVARTDGAALRVVLGNLLENAIRFSPEGGRVEVQLSEDVDGRRLAVRDHGPGIAAADLPLAFQRYWRADRARSRREGHHGLGLALARRYAGHLGATLEVESELGRGATFTVRWRT
jgi:signal transduction histidine kinase